MTKYASETGTALALARKENIRLDMNGVARLASTNLLPDPTLSDFDPDGRGGLRYWPRLGAPPVATGRNVYAREPRGSAFERFSKQNNSSLPRNRAGYAQRLSLINGAPMPGSKNPYGLDRASAALVYPIGLSNSGYPAGTYLRSYAWAIRVPGKGARGWLLTDPSPPMSFTVAEDQSTEQLLPTEVPEGVDGIAILNSEPGGVFNRMFVQRIIDVRDFVPESYTMDGPPRYLWLAPQDNRTYVGAFDRWGALDLRKRSSWTSILYMDVHTSWKFRTRFGWSASQNIRRIVHWYVERNKWFEVRPKSMPRVAEAWIPTFQGPDGGWQEPDYGLVGGELGKRQWGHITTGDSEKINTGITFDSAEYTRKDETGIPAPDEKLAAPTTFGKARIGSGPKSIRVTDIYTREDGSEYESPPSIPTHVNLGAQQGFRVDFREFAEEGNVIPNGDYEEQKVVGGKQAPDGFFYPTIRNANLRAEAQESVVEFDDSTGRTTDDVMFESDPFRIAPVPYTVRGGVVLDRAGGGLAYIAFQFRSSDESVLASKTLLTNDAAAKDIKDFTAGPVGSGCDLEWPEGTTKASYTCRLQGGSGNNRNLAGRFIHIGMFRGQAAPRKAEEDESPVSEIEPEREPYPPGSYMRVVENPSWAQGKGNGFEYYGSEPALLRSRRFAGGLQLPVEANSVYCFQADYYHEGLEAGSEIMPVSVMNAKGEATEAQVNGASGGTMLAASGNGSGQTYITIETGPDAAYLEAGDSTLGSGLLRMWGLQLTYGAVPIPWTDDVAPEGLIAAEFDTRTPEVPERLAGTFAYKRLVSGGVVADLPEGTSAPVRFRGRHKRADPLSAYYDDITAMPRYRYVEVETMPQTTDAAGGVSPEISSVFAESEPPAAVLLRPNGSEYPGGILVDNLSTINYGGNTKSQRRSDGRLSVTELHPAPKVITAEFISFLDEGAHEAARDSSKGSRLFLIEGWGVRYVVRILNLTFARERREIHGAYDVLVAASREFEVIKEIPLASEPA